MDGLIILDKPAGITSARAVAAVKRLLPTGTKVGHAGALDPLATGLLVVLVGKATRLCEKIMSMPKTYQAKIRLGATTVSDDAESPERPVPDAKPPLRQEIDSVLQMFVGTIQQRPPVYSAIKIAGKRASDRARRGVEPQIRPRAVQVHGIELLDYTWPILHLQVECGRGTYIRSIARDLGEKLGVGGYLAELRRVQVGPWRIEDSVPLSALSAENLQKHLRRVEL